LKVAIFITFLNKNLTNVELRHFGNMDEVPVSFDMPSTRTVNVKGVKEVRLKTTGNEKSNLTVILSVTSNGAKLPPMVIFKRKTPPKEKFPENICI
jgi:hypothetical protein